MSSHSRNRWLGEEIGKGRKPEDVVASTEMAVEGYATTKSAYELSRKYKTEMPITNEMYEILFNGKDPRVAVKTLMTRAPKEEIY
jgi:glycerol-3-phosphate dehydrogenase (NAD(P)+)